MTKIKRPIRYAGLYRVSTKKQMKNDITKKNRYGKKRLKTSTKNDETLPIQRAKVKQVAEENGWVQALDELGNRIEYVEGGVSAYYTPMSKRDMISKAFEDGKKGKYDVLVVYKLDRFGRRTEAYDYAVKFTTNGIRLYDASKKSEWKNEGDAQEIVNFIEFWEAKRFSQNTKERVTDAMESMHKVDNLFTGGKPPYGYQESEYAGMLKINEEEAKTVREIFNLYVFKGWGLGKIAYYLNEQDEHRTREGGFFRTTSLSKLIRNPIYKGYLAYNKTNSAQGEFGRLQKTKKEEDWEVAKIKTDEYEIVSEEIWNKAKEIRQSRRVTIEDPIYEDESKVLPSRKGTGKLIFTGLTVCGTCGGTMINQVNSKVNAKGERIRTYYYKCLNRREGGKAACDAKKVSIEKEKLENAVLSEIKQFTKTLMNTDILDNIQKLNEENEVSVEEKLKSVNKEINSLNTSIANSKMRFEKENKKQEPDDDIIDFILSGISDSKKSLADFEKQKKELLEQKNKSKIGNEDFFQMRTILEDWDALYEHADLYDKKTMLSKIISKITVHEEEIEVEINIKWGGLYEALTKIGQGIEEISASLDSEGVFHSKSVHQYSIKNNLLELHLQHLNVKMPNVHNTLRIDPKEYEVLTDLQKDIAIIYLKAHKTDFTIGEYCEQNEQSYKYLNILTKDKAFMKYCETLIASNPEIYKFPTFKKGPRKKVTN